MIQAVLFDMDGVLIDTEKYLTRYVRQAAKELGYEMSEEISYRLRSMAFQFSEPYLKKEFGEAFDYQAVRTRRQELMKKQMKEHGIEKKPDVEEVITELRRRGYRTAVVTATNEARAREYLEEVGFTGLFDEIVSASMVKNGKPMPDVYQFACEKIHLKPEECIAVEDSPNGVTSASRAGCNVIMVPDLTQPDEETRAKTIYVAENLKKILEKIPEKSMEKGEQ